MFALTRAFASARQLSLYELFRLAHIESFGHDASYEAIRQDVAVFQQSGIVPRYVIEYIGTEIHVVE